MSALFSFNCVLTAIMSPMLNVRKSQDMLYTEELEFFHHRIDFMVQWSANVAVPKVISLIIK